MKKLFLLAAAFIMLGIAPIHAQAPAPAKTKSAHMKKDGTADKRFKENKASGATSVGNGGPTKKDGTPDMRYKANKDAKKK